MRLYEEPLVAMLASTPSPMVVCGQAANLCYHKVDGRALYAMSAEEDDRGRPALTVKTGKILLHCLKAGHHSIFEHAYMTVLAEGVSRSLTHQLVRHRLASYSQQSQHWCHETPTACALRGVSGDSLAKAAQKEAYLKALASAHAAYEDLIAKGVPAHEARQVLPNGWETKIVASMNLRSWMHFIKLRACRRNTPEISIVAAKVHCLLAEWLLDGASQEFANAFMNHVGPPCLLTGKCLEGRATCGRPWSRAVC